MASLLVYTYTYYISFILVSDFKHLYLRVYGGLLTEYLQKFTMHVLASSVNKKK